jgi:hypothetical protein
MKIGDKVSVSVRFGETGTIKEIKPEQENPFGIEFHNLPFVLFFKESEIRPIKHGDKGFSWFRMPPNPLNE